MPTYQGWPSKQKSFRVAVPVALLMLAFAATLMLPCTARPGQVTLHWDPPSGVTASNITNYKVYYGSDSGNYSSSVFAGNTTAYTFTSLSDGVYYFAVTALVNPGVETPLSNEVGVAVGKSLPSLSHYNFSYPIGGQKNCSMCHIKPGLFLSGFGVRTTLGLCYSCHGAAGVGHGRPYGGKYSHPIFVNVTADSSHRKPTLGFVNGTSSDKTYTHLFKGKKVVCMTCHNSKRKPGDPGRNWELTTTTDYMTYSLRYGGWTHDAYLRPVVYRSTTLWLGPTFMRDAKQYVVSQDEYDTDMQDGTIIFHQAQPSNVYIYVTLLDDYLRNTNVNNQFCLDCHIMATHKQYDCTMCHGMHNTNNLKDIREQIFSPQGKANSVFFTSTTAMSGKTGVCVVCHTLTKYHNMTSVNPVSHYDKRNCPDCHKHNLGFPK